jgi:TM2 domain-containing membrane protein YozV
MQRSSRSYAVAVCLAGIFGTLGIHHFYLGRWLHGMIDVGMLLWAVFLIATGQVFWGIVVFGADFIHSLIVTIMLMTGAYRDGEGKVVAYPGQTLTSDNH